MDTSILHTRIAEYKAKAKHPTSKEMINLFEMWFLSIENYMSDIEMEYFGSQVKIAELKDTISCLCDIIILTGHSDKIELLNSKDPNVSKAISLLIKGKDRINHDSVMAISTLLNIYSDTEFENLKQLKDHATRE